MSIDYIRQTYGVPAKKGARVRYTGDKGPNISVREGVITGAEGAHLRIRMDGDSFSNIYHPTWELEYLDNIDQVQPHARAVRRLLVGVGAVSRLDDAITRGKEAGKLALYFGCWDRPGHYLHRPGGRGIYDLPSALELPWSVSTMDGTLLNNGKRPDVYDGKVYWTVGGLTFWYAFFWWDRSVDTRGACNSGFYVRGFGWPDEQAAFAYACEQFPNVVARQKFPLILQARTPHPTGATKHG